MKECQEGLIVRISHRDGLSSKKFIAALSKPQYSVAFEGYLTVRRAFASARSFPEFHRLGLRHGADGLAV